MNQDSPDIPPLEDPPLPDSYEPEDYPATPLNPSEIPDEPQEMD